MHFVRVFLQKLLRPTTFFLIWQVINLVLAFPATLSLPKRLNSILFSLCLLGGPIQPWRFNSYIDALFGYAHLYQSLSIIISGLVLFFTCLCKILQHDLNDLTDSVVYY